MYLLVVVLGLVIWCRLSRICCLVILWVLVGLGIFVYYYLFEWFLKQLEINVCDIDVLCSAFLFCLWYFFILLFMVGCGFFFIVSVLSLLFEFWRFLL